MSLIIHTSAIPILLQTSQPEVDVLVHITLPEPLKHPDVIWINPDNQPITIDMVRELQLTVLTKPYQADVRFFILQAIDIANPEAQQALLKILEEPPKHIVLILTAQYPTMILPTILSRVSLKTNVQEPVASTIGEVFNELSSQTLGQKLQWASAQAGQDNPVTSVLNLLADHIETLEQNPTLPNIHRARLLEKTIQLLRAKTNPKLSLEWLALHV